MGESTTAAYTELLVSHALTMSQVPQDVVEAAEVAAAVSSGSASQAGQALASRAGLPEWSVQALVQLAETAETGLSSGGLGALASGAGASARLEDAMSGLGVRDQMEALEQLAAYDRVVALERQGKRQHSRRLRDESLRAALDG